MTRPSNRAGSSGSRRRWMWAGAAVVVAAVALLWPRPPQRRTAPDRSPTERRSPFGPRMSLGPNGWQLAPRRSLGPIALRPVGAGLVRVGGTVFDLGTHNPVGDVEVVFADGTTEASAIADVAGRYSIDVPAGIYRPFVRADGVISAQPPRRERLPARPRPEEVAAARLDLAPAIDLRRNTAGVDLEVVRSGKIHGRVVDGSGRPITGVIVRAFSTDDNSTPRPILGTDVAETGADGGFDLEIAAATYRLDAYHDRFGGLTSTAVVDVQPAQTSDAELVMMLGCVISGRVARQDGSPLGSGAIERAFSTGAGPEDGYYPDGDFAEDGSFQWTTTEEMTVSLRAWPWKSTHSQARSFACRDGVRYDNVVFEIPRADPDLRGRVVRADGTPIPYAFVDIGGLSEGTMNQQERADAEGQWAVYALPPGQYRVTATADGAGAVERTVTAPAADVELRMSGTGTLVGTVAGIIDGSFRLDVLACVPAADTDRVPTEFRRVVTVSGGQYSLDGVPACLTMTVAVGHAAHHLVLDATVTNGGVTTLDLDLADPEPITVRGVVRGPDGRGVPHAMVSTIHDDSADGSDVFIETDASGRYTITAFGGDQLMVRGPDGSFGLRWLDRDSPPVVDLDVELEPSEQLSGELPLGYDQPIEED